MYALKPLFELIGNLDGFEATAFWLSAFVLYVFSGFFVDYIMQRQGFGPYINGIFVYVGLFIGIYIRYNYFMQYPFPSYEPYLTFGLLFGSIAILFVVLAFLRNRFT